MPIYGGTPAKLLIDSALKYIQINTNGVKPNITGLDSLSIGENNECVGFIGSILLGNTLNANNNNCVLVGNNLASNRRDSVVMGNNCSIIFTSPENKGSVLVGRDSTINNNDGVAFGDDIIISAGDCTAVGTNLRVVNSNSVTMGFSIFNNGFYGVGIGRDINSVGGSSVIIGHSLNGQNDCINIGHNNNIQTITNLCLGRNNIAQGNNSTNIGFDNISPAEAVVIGRLINFSSFGSFGLVAIGQDIKKATVTSVSRQSVCLGYTVRVANTRETERGVAIGNDTRIDGDEAVAVGAGAKADNIRAFQLGRGVNSTPDTLQFQNKRIANLNGLYSSYNPVSFVPDIPNNVNSYFKEIDLKFRQQSIINEETLTSDKTLTRNDTVYQDFIVNNPNLIVNLPANPNKGDRFILKNDFDSTENLTINPINVTLTPGTIITVIYGATKWIEF